MFFCKNCGKELTKGAIVCLGCGVRVGDGTRFCPNCGAEPDPLAVICVKCGCELKPLYPQTPPPPPPPPLNPHVRTMPYCCAAEPVHNENVHGFGQAVKKCFSKYASFEGRACRSEFWNFQALHLLVSFIWINILGVVVIYGGSWDLMVWSIPLGLYSLAVLLPNIAVSVRRMHDIGMSGLWVLGFYLIQFIPIVGSITSLVLQLVFMSKDSQPYANEYGNNPKGSDPELPKPDLGLKNENVTGFWQAIKKCFSKYLSFKGRASRAEYWYFQLLYLIVFTLLLGLPLLWCRIVNYGLIDWHDIQDFNAVVKYLYYIPFNVKVICLTIFWIPIVSVTVRRLHDMGKSGWWALLLCLLQFGFMGAYPFLSDPWLLFPFDSFSHLHLSEHDYYSLIEDLLPFFDLYFLGFLFIWICFMCKNSKTGPNEYGTNPKEFEPGHRIESEVSESPVSASASAPCKRRLWLWVLLVAAVVAGVLFFMLPSGSTISASTIKKENQVLSEEDNDCYEYVSAQSMCVEAEAEPTCEYMCVEAEQELQSLPDAVSTDLDTEFTPKQYNQINGLLHDILKNNRSSVVQQINYPLALRYPLPDIRNAEEMLSFYNLIFTDSFKKHILDNMVFDEIGWRGVYLCDGLMWGDFYEDGFKIRTILKQDSPQMRKLWEDTVEKRRQSLHPSVQEFIEPVMIMYTSKYIIMVDKIAPYKYRYAAWYAGASMKSKPNVVLNNGEAIGFGGSMGGCWYKFKSGIYEYHVDAFLENKGGGGMCGVSVLKNGELALFDEMIRLE